ncbi:MAG: DUF4364 family protein [Ruminiclostridium sp.]|nr:DUF4364 family protein [Ruminiclostridium sp.]MBQ8411010.1 DUF4364 family protein [Ruminiclostridium sp.]
MIPQIQVDDSFDICVYFCFMLKEFGDITDSFISEIVISLESVNYFELMSEVGKMEKKQLISIKNDKEKGEQVYSLLPNGETLANEFLMHIPLSIREKTIEAGKDVLERIEREKSIRCYINYDYKRKRYDLCVKFLNELNGEVILDIKLYAPTEEKAKEMKERFLSRPSRVITRTMNMFLKDDFFMYDN